MIDQSATPVTGAAHAASVRDAGAPMRLSHLAYVTHDTRATVDFYTRIMRMPLIEALMNSKVPSTGDPFPYVHFFFRMQDGSTIAFFEAVGLPERSATSHPAYDTFDHLALEVANPEEVDAWRDRLVADGVEVLGPVDHGIIYSIYFHDPNGIRLEITTPLVADWNDRPDAANAVVDAWLGTKESGDGTDLAERLRTLIASNEHSSDLEGA